MGTGYNYRGDNVLPAFEEVKRLTRKIPANSMMFSGILLVLVIVLMIIMDSNPIGLSKNALSKTQKTREILRLPGKMSWAGDDGFFNFDRGVLKRLDGGGKVFWEKRLEGKELLWIGPGGFTVNRDSTLEMWNAAGELEFRKDNFFENPAVLSFEGDFLLLAGKLKDRDYAALLNKKGTVLWLIPVDGRIISGRSSKSGSYTVLNLMDENLSGKMVLVNSEGLILWQIDRTVMILLSGIMPDGVEAVAEDRVFKADFEGRIIREQIFQDAIFRADIGQDGYMVVAVKQREAKLTSGQRPKIIMLDPECRVKWSYVLERQPLCIKKYMEFVYIVYDDEILVLSREGLLTSSIKSGNIKDIDVVDISRLIINHNDGSSLIAISGRR